MLKIGLQAYSVRKSMCDDSLSVLKRVGEIGYKYIEFANHHAITDDGIGFNAPASEVKQALDSVGVQTASCHLFPGRTTLVDTGEETNDDYDQDYSKIPYDKIFRYNEILENRNLGISMTLFSGPDDVLRKCEQYNKIGKYCHDNGFVLHYHNHYEIGQHFNGKTVWEMIMENTDSDYLKVELDTFWAMRGGLDPVELIKKWGNRINLLHQKDFAKDASDPACIFDYTDESKVIDYEAFGRAVKPDSFTEIGNGIMDIQSIIDAANRSTSAEYMFLEQDESRYDEITSIGISMDSFRKFKGVIL